jgi:hypothetical protein
MFWLFGLATRVDVLLLVVTSVVSMKLPRRDIINSKELVTASAGIYNSGYSASRIGYVDGDGGVFSSGYGGGRIGHVERSGGICNSGYGGGRVGHVEATGA